MEVPESTHCLDHGSSTKNIDRQGKVLVEGPSQNFAGLYLHDLPPVDVISEMQWGLVTTYRVECAIQLWLVLQLNVWWKQMRSRALEIHLHSRKTHDGETLICTAMSRWSWYCL